MRIMLNGTEIELHDEVTVAGLLEQKGLPANKVVVEVNNIIIERDEFGEKQLGEGDKVEILRFVGGG
ncbi:MAG: sulfur carrier protein ThiS [Bacillota bacterium]|jgi:thiamine biosynthesis protein ThiS